MLDPSQSGVAFSLGEAFQHFAFSKASGLGESSWVCFSIPLTHTPLLFLREDITYQRGSSSGRLGYICKSSQRPLSIKIFTSRVQKEINICVGASRGSPSFLGKMLIINASGCLQNAQVLSQVRGLFIPLCFLPINPILQPLFVLIGAGSPVRILNFCPIIFCKRYKKK